MYQNMNYVICATVMTQTIDDETVLMDTQTHHFYGLNSVGTALWEIMQKYHTLNDVVNEMIALYDVSEEQLQNDVKQFARALQDHGMITLNENL